MHSPFFKTILWIVAGLAGIPAAVVLFLWLFWSTSLGVSLGDTILRRGIEAQINLSLADNRPDGLLLGVCGAGGPIANPVRTGPCLFVRAGERIFVVDAGQNAARNLSMMRVPFNEVQAVLLTHFHSDHIDGLGELQLQRWIVGQWKQPLAVAGPKGVEGVVYGFNMAYSLDQKYRTEHHGETVAPQSGFGLLAWPIPEFADASQSAVIYDQDDLKITAFPVDHDPATPAVGYRFDYKGRSLVISGDTKKVDSIVEQAKGVDLLVHEALQARMVRIMGEVAAENGVTNLVKITEDILDYHATPEEAAETAAEAGVSNLLLYHIVPPLPTSLLDRAFLGAAADYFDGPIYLAEDMQIYSLPLDSYDVILED